MNWCVWERIGSRWARLLWAETQDEALAKMDDFPAETTYLPVERVVLRDGELPWLVHEPTP